MPDASIAGAGPAGLAAATILAKNGYSVRVYEQRSDVGERFNDDFQGLENWSSDLDVLDELTHLGIQPNWWLRSFNGGAMFSPSMRSKIVLSSKPLFYMVRRGNSDQGSLDKALLRQAIDSGVQIVFNKRVSREDVDIWAAGPSGPAKAIAAGITFTHHVDDFACVMLSEDLAPSGYVYYLVADGKATLATVLFRDFPYVHEALEKSRSVIARTYGINSFPDEKKWGGFGGFAIKETCEVDGALLVGEAGGFQDFLFGFGIRNALLSGGLAAKSILEGTSYDKLWRKRLLGVLKASAVNRNLYDSFGDLAKNVFWLAATKSKRPDRLMKWIYNYSSLHKLIYPFSAKN